ncbi:Ig-like domain-containing protein [Pseudomonas brenneri]
MTRAVPPISGKAEAGSTVEITLPDGTTTKVMADKDGHFSHTDCRSAT